MTRTLSDTARIIWSGALRGRQCARLGHRNMAFTMAEPLRFVNSGPENLQRLAKSAAIDIERILMGEDLEADKRDNVVRPMRFTERVIHIPAPYVLAMEEAMR